VFIVFIEFIGFVGLFTVNGGMHWSLQTPWLNSGLYPCNLLERSKPSKLNKLNEPNKLNEHNKHLRATLLFALKVRFALFQESRLPFLEILAGHGSLYKCIGGLPYGWGQAMGIGNQIQDLFDALQG